jgi:alpha-beta hydrolase superfamily lysophospholipase
LWAAQLLGDYAPELDLVTVALAAPAINLSGILERSRDVATGTVLVAQAMYAWSSVYDDIRLEDVVRPEMLNRVRQIAEVCVTKPLAYLPLQPMPKPSEFLTVDLLTSEPYRTILEENTPREALPVPILISHGTSDPLIASELSVTEAARRCDDGEQVLLVPYPSVGHDAA